MNERQHDNAETAAAELKALVPSDDFLNLTAANPDQEMNRSADRVRVAMRAYVDAGTIDENGLESLVRLFGHGKARNLSFDAVGKLIDYSGSTMSRIFAGKYTGAMDDVIAKVDGFLALEAERQKMTGTRFIETSIWEKVKAVCDLAISHNALTRVVGPSQIGKTAALKEYVRRAKFQACYVRIPAAPTFKTVVDAFCRAVGVTSQLRVEESRARVSEAIGRNTLLVVDELHEVVLSAGKTTALKCMEWIREIWDMSGCGMVLCGTTALEDDLINDSKMRGWLGQLDQRCIRVLKLPSQLPMADVVKSAEAYGIGGSTAKVENLLRGIRMNRLTTVLAMTVSWCNGNNKAKVRHPKNWESFAAVYRQAIDGVSGEVA